MSEELQDLVNKEVALQAEDAREAARLSPDFLAALAMPAIFRYMLPPVFKAVWEWLLSFVHQDRVFPKLALGLPRGFAKTTVIKLFLLYCILFTKRKFILVLSSNAGLAENIVADVIDMLSEPNIKKLFGDWALGIEKDTQAIKKFSFRGRTIILAALGAGSSLRGLNLKNERPDVMVFDDIQTREQADSEIQSKALEQWMYGTAMKAKSPHGCMYIFVGNMYPTRWSILRKLKQNHTWTKFIVGGILADGTSLWEELHPIAQLLEEYEADVAAGFAEIFHSEVLNDEHAAANSFNISKLPLPPFDWDEPIAGSYIIIDPATDKSNADAVSVGYCEVRGGFATLRHVTEGRLSPGETIVAALKYGMQYNCRLVFIEGNAYQSTLGFWFSFICKQRGIEGFRVQEIYSGSRSKVARILDMLKSLSAGEIFIHEDAKSAAFHQINAFNPLRRDNVDGILDLLTYAGRILKEFAPLVARSNILEASDFAAIEVAPVEETCSF